MKQNKDYEMTEKKYVTMNVEYLDKIDFDKEKKVVIGEKVKKEFKLRVISDKEYQIQEERILDFTKRETGLDFSVQRTKQKDVDYYFKKEKEAEYMANAELRKTYISETDVKLKNLKVITE